jgi:hypothetical protein
LLVLAVSILSAALAVWMSRSPSETPRPTRTHVVDAPRPWAPSWPTLTWGTQATGPSDRAWSQDAGVGSGDAAIAPPEPELEATGRVAREVAARVCPTAARAVCAARDRFGCALATDPNEEYPDDEAPLSCVERVSIDCEDWATRTYAGAPDLLVLDDETIARCTNDLAADLQDGLATRASQQACVDLPANPRRAGERCEASWYRCADGSDCIEHRCVARPGDGEPCDQGICAVGLVCVAELCSRPTPRGAPCDDESVCAERDDACFEGRCAAAVRNGGACVEDYDCALGSRCLLGRCARAGATCTHDEPCGRGRYCTGTWSPHCVRVHVGAPCLAQRDCDLGLECAEGTCIALTSPGPLGEGEPCEVEGPLDAQCGPTLLCVWAVVDGACRAAFCLAPDPFEEPIEDCH